MNFVETVIQVERQILLPLPSGKRLQSTFPNPCLHQTSQNSHKFNSQTKVCKKSGFTYSLHCFLQSFVLLALLSSLSYFFFFLQFCPNLSPNTFFLEKAFCLLHFLMWQSSYHPFQYPSCLCKGKLLGKPRAIYIWKGITFPVTSLASAAPSFCTVLLCGRLKELLCASPSTCFIHVSIETEGDLLKQN